jgi:hypothetical protein
MAKKRVWLGISVLVLVFGLVLAGCDNGSGGSSGGGGVPATDGKLTITNVPSDHIGKYAYVHFQISEDEFWGGSNWVGEETLYGVEITAENRTSLGILIWKENDHQAASFNGSGSANVSLYINAGASVSGSNWQGSLGSTTKTWSGLNFSSGVATQAWE